MKKRRKRTSRVYASSPAHSSIDDFKTIVIYSTLGLATASGVFLAGRHFYKKSKANNVEKKSLQEGNPATYAKQLKMAFDNDTWFGWGTNESQVMQVFNQIPSKAFYQKVQKAYTDLYGTSLNSDLEDELSSDDYNTIIRILSSKNAK